MTVGYLVNPDLTARKITFEIEQANQFLGGITGERVSVSFLDDGDSYAALFNGKACLEGAEPNPVASLGRSNEETGDSTFLTDPARAIAGSVIFVGVEGESVSESDIEDVDFSIRAVRNYRLDSPEEYGLWRSAAMNFGLEDV